MLMTPSHRVHQVTNMHCSIATECREDTEEARLCLVMLPDPLTEALPDHSEKEEHT